MGESFAELFSKFKHAYQNKQFTASEARAFGIPHVRLYALVKNKEIERVAWGHYRFPDYFPVSLEAQFQEASQLVSGKTAICLIPALGYYGLTDIIVTKPWLLVGNKTTSRNKSIHLFRRRKPMWNVGIETKDGFNITSIERTIVECIAFRSTTTGNEGTIALRKAISKGKVKIENVYRMAQKLGYLKNKRIEGILEAYLDEE